MKLYCSQHTDTHLKADGTCPKCPELLPNVYLDAKVKSSSDNIKVESDMKKVRELQAHLARSGVIKK